MPILIELVATDEPAIKREAATALGRIGDPLAVPTLLDALASADDRFLEHALIYALIEIDDRAATLAGLAHESALVRRGALVALDQMDGGRLTQELVAPLVNTNDTALLRTIVEVLAGHPDWAEEITSVLATWLTLPSPSVEQLATARGAVVSLGQRPPVEKLVVRALASDTTSKAVRLMLLEALAAGDYDQPPGAYNDSLAHNLQSNDTDVVRQTILMIGALDARPFSAQLIAIGLDTRRPEALRTTAFQVVCQLGPELSKAGYDFLADRLHAADTLGQRLAAAEALGQSKLNEEQLRRAADSIASCGPLEVSWLLQAFERDTSRDVGLALVAALARSPGLESVAGTRLRDVLANYPGAVRDAARDLVARPSPDDAQRAAKIDALEIAIEHGDVALGEDVFFSSRAACSACHRIEARGERIGPDLSKIGEARNGRDLAEAILFPSASLARGYESFHVVTTDGKVASGMLSRETTSAIYLRTLERAEIRVSHDAIDEISPSLTSIMPQGLEKTLSDRQLADLVAYLLSRK